MDIYGRSALLFFKRNGGGIDMVERGGGNVMYGRRIKEKKKCWFQKLKLCSPSSLYHTVIYWIFSYNELFVKGTIVSLSRNPCPEMMKQLNVSVQKLARLFTLEGINIFLKQLLLELFLKG